MRVTNSLLNAEWIVRLASFSRLIVGLSGGLDSIVLLHCLNSIPVLARNVSAIHIHHGLSVFADEWLTFCERFCAQKGIALQTRHVELNNLSANIEEQARIARYDAFSELVNARDALLLAHHADDQAETILLQLMRGAGVDGLAAMLPLTPWRHSIIIRPFLQQTKACLQAYAIDHGLQWVNDDSNDNQAFSRNYIRHQVMPLLKARWPGVVNNLVRTTTHCQQAKINLRHLAYQDCPELKNDTRSLSLTAIQQYPFERLTNILRVWIGNCGIKLPSTQILYELVTQLAARCDAAVCIQWDKVLIRRYQNRLYLLNDLKTDVSPAQMVRLALSQKGLHLPPGCRMDIRFRTGGETFFWHGQQKILKKLWQQWQVPPWKRDIIPLIWIDDELAAVSGFAISDTHYGENKDHLFSVELICPDR